MPTLKKNLDPPLMVLSMDILLECRSLKCSAHCLQLCVNAGLTSVSVVEHTIASAKKLVDHFRHSVVASEALKERQQLMGIDQKTLIHLVQQDGIRVMRCC